jgi:hypothetical protein
MNQLKTIAFPIGLEKCLILHMFVPKILLYICLYLNINLVKANPQINILSFNSIKNKATIVEKWVK